MNFTKALDTAKIPFKILKRRSEAVLLTLSMTRKVFHISLSKEGKIEAYPNAKFRQVVLSISEPEREITRTFQTAHSVEELKSGGGFPIALDKATYKVISRHRCIYSEQWEARVKATPPATINTFLVGYDEEHLFISHLPRPAKSVREAHEILRPKNVPKGSPRMGEFFFVPVNNTMEKKFDKSNKASIETYYDIVAISITKRLKTYMKGFIQQDSMRHKPIVLNSWHEIVYNTELESDQDTWD